MAIDADFQKTLGSFALHTRLCAGNETVALFGASGCGKSISLKCIAGIIKPDEGYIIVDGITLFDSRKNINLIPQERNVGVIFQNYALFPNMTFVQNVMTGLNRVRDLKQKKKKLNEILEMFYLTGLENHHPAQLSGGQQQRCALARMFASEPRIIMLANPFLRSIVFCVDSWNRNWRLRW